MFSDKDLHELLAGLPLFSCTHDVGILKMANRSTDIAINEDQYNKPHILA